MRRDETPRDTAAKAMNKAFGQIAGLLELLEAGLPPEHRQNARNVRLMALDSLHQLRMSIEQQRKQGE